MQRQLHPHFLFNTLHTISALMYKDTDAADAMLERLSDLLRLTRDRIGTEQDRAAAVRTRTYFCASTMTRPSAFRYTRYLFPSLQDAA